MLLLDFAFYVVQFQVDVWIIRLEPLVNRLGEEDGAVLSARAAEGDHQVAEMPLTVVVDALSDDSFHMFEKDMDGRFGHQIINDFPVAPRLGLELRFAARVGQGAAVEDEAAAVAAEVVGIAFFEGETVDSYCEFRV